MSDSIKRNPHPDFKKVEASRPSWDTSSFKFTKTVDPEWKFGQGANELQPSDTEAKKHISIDPYQEGRSVALNYKLLISAITPRPIAFLSTASADGKSTNLAPFSYFNIVNHDPPLFIVGFSSSVSEAKDSLRNIIDTKECVINIISDSYIEAANSASVNAPYGTSEWEVSGLTPVHDCQTVKCARVKEAVFSVEAKLDMLKEFDSRAKKGAKSGTMVIMEGTRMWAREDALNEDMSLLDPSVRISLERVTVEVLVAS